MLNPVSKVKFDAAQELIDQKDYAGARVILKGIDDPTARDWERKIDALQPAPTVVHRTKYLSISVAAFAVGGLALMVALASFLDPRIDYSVRSGAAILTVGGMVVAYLTNKLAKR